MDISIENQNSVLCDDKTCIRIYIYKNISLPSNDAFLIRIVKVWSIVFCFKHFLFVIILTIFNDSYFLYNYWP